MILTQTLMSSEKSLLRVPLCVLPKALHLSDAHTVSSSPQMTILANNWAALLGLWDQRQLQYQQCMYLHLFYRDSEQVDSWMSRQEVTARAQRVSRSHFSHPSFST